MFGKFKLLLLILLFVIIPSKVASQNQGRCAVEGSEYKPFFDNDLLRIDACIGPRIFGSQSVNWRIWNKSRKNQEVSFYKVYTLSCGRIVNRKASISLKPKEKKEGHSFFGDDLDLNDDFFSDDCDENRIVKRVAIENLEDLEKMLEETRKKIEEKVNDPNRRRPFRLDQDHRAGDGGRRG